MGTEVKYIVTISKKAYSLVRSGKAVIEKGGVKDLNGQFIELFGSAVKAGAKEQASFVAKGVAKSAVNAAANAATGGILGGLNLASSVGCNVQCAFIQKGVNEANFKLDIIQDRLEDLSKAVSSLGRIESLSWLNCATSIANIGITVAGFVILSQKIDSLEGTLHETNQILMNIYQDIRAFRISDKKERFTLLCLNAKGDLATLKVSLNTGKSLSNEQYDSIRVGISKLSAFLNALMGEFGRDIQFDRLYCAMIVTLSSLFTSLVNVYTAKYYYDHQAMPANYSDWIQIVTALNSDSFLNCIRNHLVFAMPELPIHVREKASDYVSSLMNHHAFQIDYTNNLIHALPSARAYERIDDYLTYRIKSCNDVVMLPDGRVAL